MKWHVLLAAQVLAALLFLAWCDWQNENHNRAIHRGYWSHICWRVYSWF